MSSVRHSLRLRHLVHSASHSVASFRTQNPFPWRRCIHHLRELPYNVDEGLGDFLSPASLRMIAIDYQQGLLTRLNEQVKGTEMANQSVTQTVISTASHRRHALAFNYASQALNNSFFFECLKPPPPPPATNEDLMGSFAQDIRFHFGSLTQLKSTFSAAALGMINSGWVWLVSDENGNLQVVATFGAGTLLVRSRHHMLDNAKHPTPVIGEERHQGPLTRSGASGGSTPSSNTAPPAFHDRPSATSPTSGLQKSAPGLAPSTPSRVLHASAIISQSDDVPNIFDRPTRSTQTTPSKGELDFDEIGDILTPILCVSVQEHAWVGAGYGVWGKEEYLKRFWTVVDWEAVGKWYDRAKSRR